MSTSQTQSSYRWVIVACGALMTCVGIGAMFSLAIFLEPMSRRHRLVARRHLERHDAQLPGHGRRPASAGARSATASGRASWC